MQFVSPHDVPIAQDRPLPQSTEFFGPHPMSSAASRRHARIALITAVLGSQLSTVRDIAPPIKSLIILAARDDAPDVLSRHASLLFSAIALARPASRNRDTKTHPNRRTSPINWRRNHLGGNRRIRRHALAALTGLGDDPVWRPARPGTHTRLRVGSGKHVDHVPPGSIFGEGGKPCVAAAWTFLAGNFVRVIVPKEQVVLSQNQSVRAQIGAAQRACVSPTCVRRALKM